jgi:Rrf2 family cysteine metabolism transcriptional repressor
MWCGAQTICPAQRSPTTSAANGAGGTCRILRSQRGVKGGYSLARPAEEITVLQLVELLDGPLGAGATGVFATAAQAAGTVLAEATVASVAEEELRSAPAPMYYI